MKVELKGKVALVTGAAQGIGRAIADTLAGNGATVVYSDLDGEAASAAARAQGSGLALALDVSDEDSVARGVALAMERYGQIDILVNNAGIGVPATERKTIDQFSLKAWNDLLKVDLTGLFLMSREVSRIMVLQKSGRIVNIASVLGRANWFTNKCCMESTAPHFVLDIPPHTRYKSGCAIRFIHKRSPLRDPCSPSRTA